MLYIVFCPEVLGGVPEAYHLHRVLGLALVLEVDVRMWGLCWPAWKFVLYSVCVLMHMHGDFDVV